MSTAVAGFLTFLKDGLGVITPIVGKASLGMMFGIELAGIGLGMFLPLAVGLSGLLGVWFISTFGDTVGQLVALNGTKPEAWSVCRTLINEGTPTEFLTANCGDAAK